MSTFRNPVGPQSSGVYWRRRLVVLLVLLAIVIAVVLIVMRPGAKAPASHPSGGTPSPSSSASAGAEADCAPSVVTVTAVTDKGSYGSGEQPLLSMSIVNTGSVACKFSAGSDVQVYAITSGTDQIWSSKDCQTAPVTQVAVLQPNVAVSSAPFPWDRTRSSTTTCQGSRAAVKAGGASYHLSVTVNGVAATSSKQFILN